MGQSPAIVVIKINENENKLLTDQQKKITVLSKK